MQGHSTSPNNETSELNSLIDQMDLTDIFRIFYSTATEHAFFLEAHRAFFRVGHILGHKASLKK
jgi:hypothetical protein